MPVVSDSAKATSPPGQNAPPKPPPNSYRDSTLPIFALLLAYRIVNALTLRSFFQPDEFFQSLEPAWQLAFGPTSNAWITWVKSTPSFSPLLINTLAVRRCRAICLTMSVGVDHAATLVPASRVICRRLSICGKSGRRVWLDAASQSRTAPSNAKDRPGRLRCIT